jgi:hypothetical protein
VSTGQLEGFEFEPVANICCLVLECPPVSHSSSGFLTTMRFESRLQHMNKDTDWLFDTEGFSD